MNQYAIFTLFWNQIAIPVDAATAGLIGALLNWVGPRFQTCVLAGVMIYMIISAAKSDEDAPLAFVRKVFVAGFIYSMVSNADTYNYFVTNLVHGTVTGISTAVGAAFNNGAPLTAGAFDQIAARAYSAGLAIFKNIPWYSLKTIPLGITVVIYWFISLSAIVFMYAIYLLSYVLTDFLIGVGPLFVSLYFFEFTRRWFDGWLNVLITGVLVQIFTAALGAMFVQVLTTVFVQGFAGLVATQGQVNGGAVIGELLELIITALACVIFAILAYSLISIAAGIAGGVHATVSAGRLPGWMSRGHENSRPVANDNPPSSGSGPSGGQSGPGPAGGQGGSPGPGWSHPGQPPPEYAFNRNVGSAS